jgi:nitrous oxidase accessory protein NosD
VSYTLTGRLHSRLAASLVPVVVACVLAAALPAWWPLLLAVLMVGVGLLLDVLLYDAMDYQPGWYALPLGLLELGLLMALVRALEIHVAPSAALGFYAGSWLLAVVLANAGFPLLRLSYAEDGGELGMIGGVGLAVVAAVLSISGLVYWQTRPPTVHLAAGVHRGPIVLDKAQTFVGETGAIVHGPIVVRADHVIVRNVSVVARGMYGIVVDDARHVLLDHVRVRGAALDGIHVRLAQVTIRDCEIASPPGYTQAIDISFSMHAGMSKVHGCTIVGGREGIVTHSAMVDVAGNEVRGTSLRAIDMTEMSMGEIRHNSVRDALGVGIFCGDSSECEIEGNRVAATRSDDASGDLARSGYGIVVHFRAHAELHKNDLRENPRRVGVFADASVGPLP